METKKQANGPKNLGRSLGFLVHDVARLMRRAFDRRVKHLGLTRSQWFVVLHLYRTDGQTQRHLADELDMQRAPLSKMLDRLEVAGWIERRVDPNDRRANRIHITHKIDSLMLEGINIGEHLVDEIFEGVDDDARDQFLTVLATAKSNLVSIEQQEAKSAGKSLSA